MTLSDDPREKIWIDKYFKNLALQLAEVTTENKTKEIINKCHLMKDPNNWRPYNDDPRNWDRAGGQAADPIPALAEKLTNSIDALLMRVCWEKGIRPDSEQAPETMKEAAEKFFNIPKGQIANLSKLQRTELADNIQVIVSGSAQKPCYAIIDRGEGQAPYKIPTTFVSLGRDNKERIKFVQGKYNQGGTAALSYSGLEMSQLIISKRVPKLAKIPEDSLWGFTFVRRREPRKDEALPVIEYFAPKGKIAAFEAKELPLLPADKENLFSKGLEFGSFLKLYEYDMGPNARTKDLGLMNALSQTLFSSCLPIRLRDSRVEREGTWERTFSGTDVRLDDPEDEEVRYLYQEPYTITRKILDVGEIRIQAIPFKEKINWLGKIGVMYTRNGQVHATDDYYFFPDIGFAALRQRMLIVVDCTDLEKQVPHLIFSTSRDRMKRKHPAAKQIIGCLKEELKNHPGIKELNRIFHEENIGKVVADQKDLEDIFSQIARQDPSIAELFGLGVHLRTLMRVLKGGRRQKFQGKKFPTFLNPVKGLKDKTINIPRGSRREILCSTDAQNNYLDRIRDPGQIICEPANISCGCALSDGLASFKIDLPDEIEENKDLEAMIGFTDVSKPLPLSLKFKIHVIPKTVATPPNDTGVKKEQKEPTKKPVPPKFKKEPQFNLPRCVPVKEGDDNYKRLEWTNEDGFAIEPEPDSTSIVVFLNISNKYYVDFILRNKSMGEDPIIEKQYQTSALIYATALWKRVKDNTKERDDMIRRTSAAFVQISLFLTRRLSRMSFALTRGFETPQEAD